MSSETLAVGQPAPQFRVAAYGNPSVVSLDALRGKIVVLYFYPKDDTPGCTTEGREFTALYPEFQAAGAEILGVSRDTVASHEKFACKFDFPFPLLADTDETLCKAFDVLQEKNLYGKVGIGVERSTFIVDREGKIAYIERKVKAAGHAAAMLRIVKQLP
ncbi:peroxiredoxin [Acidithiobacillus ferrianus]|uniref:thioredoxin-dependent peroxiredoxin n=2 Tax=Acidithiobacillus ferrianus TaxID=2678518 RepID=A0A845UR38_9PROT|nr:peroxiredoxin [Acidithiobacillus ferrianus]NDU43948.1 redoxin domain-containing protein [Acidithiobacillus ferrianus]